MRTWAMIVVAVATVAGCATRVHPHSLDALTEAAVDAVIAGDADAYVHLMAGFEVARALCPAEIEAVGESDARRLLDAEHTKMVEHLAACRGFDWASATRVSVSGGEPGPSGNECPGLGRYGDLTVHFDRDGKHVLINLGKVVSSPGGERWYVVTAPLCVHSSLRPPMPWPKAKVRLHELAASYVDAACRCKDAECASFAGMHFQHEIAEIQQNHRLSPADRQELQSIVSRATACQAQLEATPSADEGPAVSPAAVPPGSEADPK